MYGFCHNSDEHKKEGREDFERHGRYGYDHWKYDDHFNDCNKAYTDGFNEARREEERREERRQEEEAEERRQYQRQKEHREMMQAEEDAYWEQVEQQQEPEQQFPENYLPPDLPF